MVGETFMERKVGDGRCQCRVTLVLFAGPISPLNSAMSAPQGNAGGIGQARYRILVSCVFQFNALCA
jgi:hypothetical protein